jgi:signal peptidase
MLPLSKKRFWIGASGLVTLVVLAAGWLLVAPTQLGGRTSYVVTSGNSMEPRISKGDLAITRRRSSYAVGDVVLYDSPALRANVLHRIVAVEGDAFVTKGDNNDFLDGEQPALDDLRGELWLVVPGAGRVLLWFQQPVNLGLAAFILVLLMLGGGREVARRRTRAAAPPRPLVVRETSRAATRETRRALSERALLVAGVASVGVFAALGVLAWSKPTRERGAVAATYAHTGELAYAARMPRSPVYPTGRLATGDSVFLRLVKGLDLRFDYTFTSTEHAEVRGTISLDAVVSDGQGWTRTLPVAVARSFTGSHASAAGRLGIPQLTGALPDRLADQCVHRDDDTASAGRGGGGRRRRRRGFLRLVPVRARRDVPAAGSG